MNHTTKRVPRLLLPQHGAATADAAHPGQVENRAALTTRQ